MWFNILKNEGRRAAYRFFINSMIHQGELIPLKDPEVILDEGGIRLLGFDTSNGHFGWHVEHIPNRVNNDLIGKFYLADVPSNIESYTDYMEGMFEQEYPEQYAALKKFFMENAPATEEREEDEEESELSSKKKLIRKIMEDWGGYMDNINSFILNAVENINSVFETDISVPRYRRLLQADINTNIPYKEVRDHINLNNPFTEADNLPLATIRAITAIYGKTLRNRNPDIAWETFINFIANFRREYMRALNISLYTEDPQQAMEDAIQNITYPQMRTLARNIWASNPNDVESVVRHLPNYN